MPKVPQDAARPRVSLRRLPVDVYYDSDSCRIDEQILAYLSVEITFLGEPVSNLAVAFLDESGVELARQGACDPLITGDDGRCAFPVAVAIGTYYCLLESQTDPAMITTVEDTDKPFALVLPFGRPYFDYFMPDHDKGAA